jgi:hypothetical protein
MECPTVKTPLEGHFYCYFSTPTTVKVAEIAPWIHHSLVKLASFEWECIPLPISPFKITLQNVHALPQEDPQESLATSEQ